MYLVWDCISISSVISFQVEVKPYVLDDQLCDECQGARCGGKFAPFFCANVTCLQVKPQSPSVTKCRDFGAGILVTESGKLFRNLFRDIIFFLLLNRNYAPSSCFEMKKEKFSLCPFIACGLTRWLS